MNPLIKTTPIIKKKTINQKPKKLTKSTSERLIEEYEDKISSKKKNNNISNPVIKSTCHQNNSSSPFSKPKISFPRPNSNLNKKSHNRNPSVHVSNTSTSSIPLKKFSVNCSRNPNTNRLPEKSKSQIKPQIRVKKRNRIISSNGHSTDLLRYSEDINLSSSNVNSSCNVKIKNIISKNNKALNNSTEENSEKKNLLYKKLKFNNKKNQMNLYYKKQICLNNSVDNVMNVSKKKNSSSNTSITKASTNGINKSLNESLMGNNMNYVVNGKNCVLLKGPLSEVWGIENPEELHFFFANLFQKKKQFYLTLASRFNKNNKLQSQDDIINYA